MKQTARNVASKLWVAVLATALMGATLGQAQLSPFIAPLDAFDELNSAPVGSALGNVALQRANNIGQPPQLGVAPPPVGFGAPPAASFSELAVPIRNERPRIKVLLGARVFDAVTGELLDDARTLWVDESKKENYYDDGSHGDVTPEDGEYADVGENRAVIGQSIQRIKERLIQALYESDSLDPLEFYGVPLMSMDRTRYTPRNRRWKIIPDPNGGPGFLMAEVRTEQALEVPKFREKQREKDERVRDDWAIDWLDEYRLAKGDLNSEFFSLYIPQPPAPPRIAPPTAGGWIPFPNPGGSEAGVAGAAAGGGAAGGDGGGAAAAALAAGGFGF